MVGKKWCRLSCGAILCTCFSTGILHVGTALFMAPSVYGGNHNISTMKIGGTIRAEPNAQFAVVGAAVSLK